MKGWVRTERMVALMREPQSPARVAAASVGISLAVAFYCLLYTALAGRAETLAQSLGWAVVNILPWVPALEAAKRCRSILLAAAALAASLAASMLLGLLLFGLGDGLAFEIWRRVPTLLLVAALASAIRWGSRGQRAMSEAELPLLPRQVEWVRAAGNYVELRGCGRTIVHRASLSAVEQQLTGHGFIRIHRSMLVRRDCIARIRPEDVVLADGTHLKIGKRYRAALAA